MRMQRAAKMHRTTRMQRTARILPLMALMLVKTIARVVIDEGEGSQLIKE